MVYKFEMEKSHLFYSISTIHLNCTFYHSINRIQEQLRRIKRNEERERLRQLKERIDQGDIEQPTAEDQAKLDALSDKPTKIVRCSILFVYYPHVSLISSLQSSFR